MLRRFPLAQPAALGRVGLMLLLLLGCSCDSGGSDAEASATTGVVDPSTGIAAATTDTDVSTGEPKVDAPGPFTACAEVTTVTAAPTTIGEAITFINALPHPVSLDCFLERLERPLNISATDSVVSLQPALGVRSPRLFLFYGDLIMSVAVDGEPGNALLEFGELVAPTKSIKGELEFPIEDQIEVTAAMERVLDPNGGSQCRLCHGGEEEAPEYELAFSSDALQHRPEEDVTVDSLEAEFETCSPSQERARCERLEAVFGPGGIVQSQFPENLQTIYDYE